ncbi:MAG: TauD/TfdA family dioxygenase, partial [Gammaproteobacteria bacterium]|nr:TauD/TfdA family dioxygenase [Gammaproteobacteria bacterium]NIV74242.1 TauD/TfdA family dioxygenase [Gammaproteobacteria bacterium]
AQVPVCVHRIVQKHPITGRKCLFVNEGHAINIVEMPDEEGRALLAELCAHAIKPE